MKKTLTLLALFVLPIAAFAKDGVFPGTAKGGKRGPISVNVTVAKGKITDIAVTASKEDRTYAYDQIKAAIIKSNNYNVDVVSGASMTSKTYVAAIGMALKAAELDTQLKGALIKPAAAKK